MTRQELISEQTAARKRGISFWFVGVNLVALGCFAWGALHCHVAGNAGDLAEVRIGVGVFGLGLGLLVTSLVLRTLVRRERSARIKANAKRRRSKPAP